MTAIGAAPALNRAVVGPLNTSSGFQYWFLACFPDKIIAVRQGIGVGLMMGLANGALPGAFGLLGALLNHFTVKKVKSLCQQIETNLMNTPTSNLHASPNVIFPITQIGAISCKRGGLGNLVLPQIVLEMVSGEKQKYRVLPADLDRASAQLRQMYPTLCRP